VVPLQVPVMQAVPVGQHGSPEKPHWLHEGDVAPGEVVQTVVASVHTFPGQHALSMVPHDSQKLADPHTWTSDPVDVHVPPGATQIGDVAW
jgi:hypothetical protein